MGTKNQRLDRLVEVFLDESLQSAPNLHTLPGFMRFEWMREIHWGLETGTRKSIAQASRRIANYCDILLKRIVSDPFDENAGRFRDEDGLLDLSIDPNCTNFSLMRMLSWYFNFHENLTSSAQKKLMRAIETYALAQERRTTHFGYTNIVLMEIANRCLCGQVLGDAEMAASGYKRMQGWLEFTALASGPSEFNSPTYTGVCLHVIGALIQWTKDSKIRFLASIVQERLWLHTSLNYHKSTAQLAGPHSRAYHSDITFNPSMIKHALYSELGDERLMGPNNTLHDSDWTALRYRFFLPAHIRPLLEHPEHPFQVREAISVLALAPEISSPHITDRNLLFSGAAAEVGVL